MKNSTKDEIEGKFREVKGSLKKKTGEIIGNPELEAEGQIEKTTGKVQQKLGRVERVFEK